MSKGRWKDELLELISDYFSIGVSEGREGRNHDTKEGVAQARLISIKMMIDNAPTGQPPQDVEEFIAEHAREVSYGRDSVMRDMRGNAVSVSDLRTWMAGHVRVPVEPNDAMQAAGASAIRIETTALNKLWTANAVFRAMINASKGEL